MAHHRCVHDHASASRINCCAARREKTPQRARLALDQAEEANRNLAAIVESSDDAILSKTLEGKITTWNAGAERIYGYKTSEIVGRNVSTLAPAERKEEATRILEQLQRGESVHQLETVRMTRDGRRIEVSLTVSPLKDEHGIIIGSSTIARDITRRKRAEMETRRQRNELAHLSRVTMLGEIIQFASSRTEPATRSHPSQYRRG